MELIAHCNLKIMLRVRCIMLSIVLLCATGCLSDAEWEEVSRGLGGWDDVRLPSLILPPMPRLMLGLDSAQQENDSTLTLWLHCNYDSIIILCGLGVNYWETENAGTTQTMFEPRSDTIDFRALENFNYAYSLRIGSLEPDTYYTLCAFLDHSVKGDTVRIFNSIYAGGCQTLRTK